jgi:hypothetical protein
MEIQESRNKLNLVFDDWNQDVPKPNGSKIFPECSLSRADFISDTYDISVEYFKPEDVFRNDKTKFFYLVEHLSCSLNCLLMDKKVITEKIVDMVKKNDNLNLLFISSHESYQNKDFLYLKKFIRDNNIPDEKIYIINNNALNQIQIEKKNLKINYLSTMHVPMWYSTSVRNLETNFIKNKEGKFFICLNNMRKIHRHLLLSFLKKYDLIKNVNWSFGDDEDEHNKFAQFEDIKRFLDDETTLLLKEEIEYFYSIKEKKPDFEGIRDVPLYVHIPEIKKDQENSYVNIVSESNFFEEDLIHISEKSMKPFLYYQIPLFCASYLHVDVLRKKYGFDMFDDIVNHDYDYEKDNIKRMKKIIEQIIDLNNKKDEIIKIYPSLKERMENNKIKLLEISNMKDDSLFYKKITNG